MSWIILVANNLLRCNSNYVTMLKIELQRGDNMIPAIEKLLHVPCEVKEYTNTKGLPLFLRASYHLKTIEVAGVTFLCAEPVEKINLSAIRKHREWLIGMSGLECAFQMKTMTSYMKSKMIEDGIPFILSDKEIYLPFLGMVLNNASKKERTPPLRISYLTQKLLLFVFYGGNISSTVTQMAKALSVSKMSVTRCFDELEAFGLGLIQDNGTAGRRLVWNKGKEALWEIIRPVLRNPVERELMLDCAPPLPLPMSGLTAISHFSMLADNPYPTYAISKQALKDFQLESLPQVPLGEAPAAVVQVLGYAYLYEGDNELVVDPLTAVLSISPEKRKDPRVESAIQEIMEVFVRGEGP